MSLHADVSRNIRPWSHQSDVAMVTKCHRSHPRKKKKGRERKREMARQKEEVPWLESVCVCVWMRGNKIVFGHGRQPMKGGKEEPVVLMNRSVCGLCFHLPSFHYQSSFILYTNRRMYAWWGEKQLIKQLSCLCSTGQWWRQEWRQSRSGRFQWSKSVFL